MGRQVVAWHLRQVQLDRAVQGIDVVVELAHLLRGLGRVGTQHLQQVGEHLLDQIGKKAEEEERRSDDRRSKVVNIHATTQLKVVLVKPERFENASEIADHLREKRTVVLNLESTNKDVARRLVDFLSGVAYAGDGKIKKVSTNTYIITPYSVDLMGDLIDELENNGLYL